MFFQVTYAALAAKATWLARELVVNPGDVVVCLLPRSVELAVALFGVGLAGAASLHLEPGQPHALLEATLAEARPAAVIVPVGAPRPPTDAVVTESARACSHYSPSAGSNLGTPRLCHFWL